jgi:ubiquinone/menaquinone biosynthesis C-methylase UbiE
MFITNLYSIFIDPLLQDIRTYISKFSGMKRGDKVLDICCGTGDQVFYYEKEGIIATGVDLSPKMIKSAEKRKEKSGLTNISFRVANAKQLPFKDNSFDYVSICLGLHEMKRDERDKIITEMKRVVKKEGFLIFIDFQVPLPSTIISYLVKAIEYFAGKNHYECFKEYLKQGGLDAILNRNHLQEEKKDYTENKIIVIIKTRNV